MPNADELIHKIYDSVSDSSKWLVFLESFALSCGAEKGNFLFADMMQRAVSTNCSFGWTPDDAAVHAARFAHSDPWTTGAFHRPPGHVSPDTGACPREEMEASEAYREFYLPRDACFGFGGVILRDELHFCSISVVRGMLRGPFVESEIELLRKLMPHLQRAAMLHGELNGMRSRVTAFTGHIDRSPQAVCMLDSKRRVLYANPAASAILARNDGLKVEAERLQATSSRQDISLRKTAEAVLAGGDSPGRVKISRTPPERPPYLVLLLPLPETANAAFGVGGVTLFALIIDPAVVLEPSPALLMELFQFTPTEARVAGRLAMGDTPEELAEDAGVSIETIRTHLRRIMGKTNTNRQGAVISLILRSAPFHRC